MPTFLSIEKYDCSSIKKNPSKGDLRETKRREYRPSQIKVLFACESLPKETENFFYYKNSVLFNNTLEAFQNIFPKITQANFLEKFKELGFYLDDLCGEPVNHLKNTPEEKRKRLCLRKLYEPDFAKRIELYKPKFVIITPNGINDNILSVLSLAKCNAAYKDLPFPVRSQSNVSNYVNGLVGILNELIGISVINNLSE